MPTQEWLNRYETVKDRLRCSIDLDAYFTSKKIGAMDVDTLDIGSVNFPTGRVVVCDPLVTLGEATPYIQTVPAGTYPATICVVPSEKYGDRYACVKVSIGDNVPTRYELGMTGNEDLSEELNEGDYFGFFADAGMGCIADAEAQERFKTYWDRREQEEEDIDPYNDLFADLLEESFKANPLYQRSGGDWLNWAVPETTCNVAMFASGFGDGGYPCYFGYDSKGNLCAVYIHFIDIEEMYRE